MEIIDLLSSGSLINAVANIGYDPEVAICNLIDNSIDADAASVNVYLPTKKDEGGRKPKIHQYIISDDGCGMDRETLIIAFTLGGLREYPKYALGKFGIGLKTASLSLGNQIVVITKTKDMLKPLCGILSRKEIESSGKYEIDLGTPPPAPYDELWESYAPNTDKGTIVFIDELNSPPFEEFTEYLQRHCGIVYHMFLEDQTKSFSIKIEDTETEPTDPLFLKEAKTESFNPETWDGRTPYILLEPQSLVLDDGSECEIAATHLIHPPSFAEEGKQAEMRERYCIEKDPYSKKLRHGFYIYRNRRIIIMAELFRGIISRETSAWAFRGRLMFDETADSALSLDVKKRHCQLPSEARANLQNIIAPYQRKSIKAWKEAGRKMVKQRGHRKKDIAQESITKTPVANLDYSPGITLESEEEVKKRKKRQEQVRKQALKVIQDPKITEEALEQKAKEKDVVVSVKGLRGNRMWEIYPSKAGLSETLMNEYHSWVKTAYAEAEDEPRITIILHQLFTILARAELEVKTNEWDGLAPEISEKVFDLFRRKVGAIGEDLAETLEEELKNLSLAKEEEGE
jgi:hypothetical protein